MKRCFLLAVVPVLIACQKTPDTPASGKSDYLLMATLYQQKAAEYRALCYQSYNLARLRLDESLKTPPAKKPAVVVDVDETVLDNSPYEAQLVLDDKTYSFDSWKEWTDMAAAEPVPGALEFLRYASERGVDIFYVTNRKSVEKYSTTENLRKTGFPNADTNHVLPKTTEGSKEGRRRLIMETHEILLLCGDNLNDLAEGFDDRSVEGRFAATDSLMAMFGDRFIVLPNPMYGDWEGAVFNNRRGLSYAEKMDLRKKALKGY